jgi:hypothetical protein
MSGHDSKYFSTTKKGEIPELKEELNSQYKVRPPSFSFPSFYISITLFKQMLFHDLDLWYEAIRVSISICLIRSVYIWLRFIVWTVWFRWIFCRNYNFIGGSSYIFFLFFLMRNRRELVHRTQIEVVFPLVCLFIYLLVSGRIDMELLGIYHVMQLLRFGYDLMDEIYCMVLMFDIMGFRNSRGFGRTMFQLECF